MHFDRLNLGYPHISGRYAQYLADVHHTVIAHKTKNVKAFVDNIQHLAQLQVKEITP